MFSEIAANLKSTSTVQQHVRDHIKDFVQLHPMDSARPWPGQDRRWFQPFYVDQRDGILKRTDRLAWAKGLDRRPAPAPQDDRVPHTDAIEFRRLGGLWFEVRLGRLPRPEYRAVTRRGPTPAWARPKAKAREETVLQLVTPAGMTL